MRNKDKHKGISKIIYKFKYSLNGLFYCYKSEFSLIIHGILSILLITLGFILHISLIEWIITIICLFLILAFEIINTSLEVIVDMITLDYSEKAKIAKDLGSAATFTISFMSFIIFMLILLPKIVNLFGN